MDSHTLRVLEFDRVREGLAAHVSSPLGEKHVQALQPSTDPNVVRSRLGETTECRELLDAGDRLPLGGLYDCTDFVRSAAAGGMLQAEDLVQVASSLEVLRRLRDALISRAERAPLLSRIGAGISSYPEIETRIRNSISPRGEVLDAASAELAQIRRGIHTSRGRLTQRLESVLRNASYRLMIQDPVLVQRSGRACVPVKVEYRSQFPGLVHDQSSSGQTVFMEPMETLDAANDVRRLELEEQGEIARILQELSGVVGAQAEGIRHGLTAAGILDFINARADYGRDMDATLPVMGAPGEVALKTARHPLLTGNVVPLDLELSSDRRTVVITGPNTGGKTVALKTTGLLSLMAQAGLHIPAAAGSRLPIWPAMFADIGDEQSIAQSLSTFSSHLRQIVKIVQNLKPGTLVLLDELGAGTDPAEGAALASTLLEHLTDSDARTVVTTHFGELKELAYRLPGVENASVQFDEETLEPTYQLQMGIPGRSLALVIAARLGLPEELVRRSRERIGQDELSAWEMLRQLETDQKEAAEKRREAERDAREAARLLDRQRKELADLDRKRRDIIGKAAGDAQEAVREARDQARLILSDLRTRVERGTGTHEAMEGLGAMDRQLSEVRKKIEQRPAALTPVHFKPVVGTPVNVVRFGQRGMVVEAGPGDEVMVAVGSLKMRLAPSELEPASAPHPGPARAPAHQLQMQKAESIPQELKLLGMRAEEAVSALDKYLDDALLSGMPSVRIIHGKGTGALKHAVWEWIKGHHAVQSYRIGGDGEGGAGATIVEMVKE